MVSESNLHSNRKNNSSAFRNTVLTSSEGHVLMLGSILAFGYAAFMGYQLTVSVERFQGLLGMTAAEIVFGRITCMAMGYSMDFGHTVVVLISMLLETILVLIFYPLFVFIWRQLLVIKWLKKVSERIRQAAERHKNKIHKFGVIGLFVFVWLPFWMTGPVVGCMIGYLLGIRVWINIAAVLAGTYAAIFAWAFLLGHLHEKTVSYSSYAIVAAALAVAAAVMGWTIRQRLRSSRKGKTLLH